MNLSKFLFNMMNGLGKRFYCCLNIVEISLEGQNYLLHIIQIGLEDLEFRRDSLQTITDVAHSLKECIRVGRGLGSWRHYLD